MKRLTKSKRFMPGTGKLTFLKSLDKIITLIALESKPRENFSDKLSMS